MSQEIRTVEIPAHITHLPYGDPFDLSKDSIIIEDSGTEYLIGGDARSEKPDSVRQFGGSLDSPQYRRLLKGLIAYTLGEGEHSCSVAISAAHHQMNKFRDGPRKFILSDSARELMLDTTQEIKFKKNRSDEQWKILKMTPQDDIRVFYEYQAVSLSIPADIKSFILWQIGYGDWQQTALVQRKPMNDASHRLEGLSGAVKLFAKKSGLAFGDAVEAWRTEVMPDANADSGLNGKTVSCKTLKENCLRHWIGAATGDLLPTIEQWRTRIKNLIVSGGLAKDETFWRIFQEEMQGQSLKLWRYHELPEKFSMDTRDSSMSCVYGLLKRADLALDPGNGRLKAGVKISESV